MRPLPLVVPAEPPEAAEAVMAEAEVAAAELAVHASGPDDWRESGDGPTPPLRGNFGGGGCCASAVGCGEARRLDERNGLGRPPLAGSSARRSGSSRGVSAGTASGAADASAAPPSAPSPSIAASAAAKSTWKPLPEGVSSAARPSGVSMPSAGSPVRGERPGSGGGRCASSFDVARPLPPPLSAPPLPAIEATSTALSCSRLSCTASRARARSSPSSACIASAGRSLFGQTKGLASSSPAPSTDWSITESGDDPFCPSSSRIASSSRSEGRTAGGCSDGAAPPGPSPPLLALAALGLGSLGSLGGLGSLGCGGSLGPSTHPCLTR